MNLVISKTDSIIKYPNTLETDIETFFLNSKATFHGLLHMDTPVLDDEQKFTFISFVQFAHFCLMSYQLSRVIKCQNHLCRRTVMVLAQEYESKSEHNSMTEV